MISVLFFILKCILILLLSYLSLFIFNLFKYRFKGYKRQKFIGKIDKPSIFKRLFVQFPDRFAKDYYEKNPNDFQEYGLHMFCGSQGSGKTTSVVQKVLELKKKYPKSKYRTNMEMLGEDGKIQDWKDLVSNTNGTNGQIEVLDEIQTWFSSNQSRNFPESMLTEISQQRKQRKMLIGTAQVWSRIGKPIREQTTFVYLPVTFFGCLTWVRVSKPEYWHDEDMRFKKFIKHYFFIHTDEVRNSFDTYKKIEKYKKEGFQDKLKLVE